MLVLVLAFAGCNGTDDGAGNASKDGDGEAGRGASTTMTTVSPSPPRNGSTLHGVRYCEILTIAVTPDGSATAEVWNTMGLNDCPQDTWEAVDLDDAVAQTGASTAVRNGPRYWLLDGIEPGTLDGSLEVRSFGGLEMRSVAFVELPALRSDAAYTETSVRRDTVFTFAAGRRIYELTAPDGSIYVMQSYSQQDVPTQTVDDLASLRTRLDLPRGWTFMTRVLTEDLLVEDDEGVATVVTDEFRNTYQLRSRG